MEFIPPPTGLIQALLELKPPVDQEDVRQLLEPRVADLHKRPDLSTHVLRSLARRRRHDLSQQMLQAMASAQLEADLCCLLPLSGFGFRLSLFGARPVLGLISASRPALMTCLAKLWSHLDRSGDVHFTCCRP
ncbi:unnamed protein product [Durusdinium trenchii]|uniref:Uncharacterized protein n=1 Tax=Durusdinium trenchii TaxID=1381693 RepID=A0ABP0QJV6_9DINO